MDWEEGDSKRLSQEGPNQTQNPKFLPYQQPHRRISLVVTKGKGIVDNLPEEHDRLNVRDGMNRSDNLQLHNPVLEVANHLHLKENFVLDDYGSIVRLVGPMECNSMVGSEDRQSTKQSVAQEPGSYDTLFDPNVFTDFKLAGREEEIAADEGNLRITSLNFRDEVLPRFIQDFCTLEVSPMDGQTLIEALQVHGINARYRGEGAVGANKLPHLLDLGSNESMVRSAKYIFKDPSKDTEDHDHVPMLTQFLNCFIGDYQAPAGKGVGNSGQFREHKKNRGNPLPLGKSPRGQGRWETRSTMKGNRSWNVNYNVTFVWLDIQECVKHKYQFELAENARLRGKRVALICNFSQKMSWRRGIAGIMQGQGFEALYGYSPQILTLYIHVTIIKSEVMSSDTKQRVTTAKKYIENHYKEQMKNLQEGREGQNVLKKKLIDADVSEEGQYNLLKHLEKKETEYMRLQGHKMGVENFELLTMIGKGACGKVRVYREKTSGQVYAMKKLKKSEMLHRDQVEHVKAERNLLAEVDSNCIVTLYCSFQDEDYLYLIMEYLPGGNMMTLLLGKDKLTKEEARFYVAEVVGSDSKVLAMVKILTTIFGKDLGSKMNACEGVAIGCALEYAIPRPTFTVASSRLTRTSIGEKQKKDEPRVHQGGINMAQCQECVLRQQFGNFGFNPQTKYPHDTLEDKDVIKRGVLIRENKGIKKKAQKG